MGPPTGSVEVLVLFGNTLEHLEPKRDHLAPHLLDLLHRKHDTLPEPEVLRNPPHGPPLPEPLVPLQQRLGVLDVLGNGLLAQHVLAGGQRLHDELGLGGDGQRDDDGVDVFAVEEGLEGVFGVGGREVDVGGGLCGLGEGGGGCFRARVDCLEGDGFAGLNGGEVLCSSSAWPGMG